MNARYFFILFICSAPIGCNTSPDSPEDTDTLQTDFDEDTALGIREISATVHPDVRTVIQVRWHQTIESKTISIRYTFENDEWHTTPPRPGDAGDHKAVLLGIPENTPVTFYFAPTGRESEATDGGLPDGGLFDGGDGDAGVAEPLRFHATTGALPGDLPRPTILSYDSEIAGPEPWILGSVENTRASNAYYMGPFWIYIMDRRGRIVWYYRDRADNPCMAYPRIAADGSHLTIEKRHYSRASSYAPRVLQITLDYAQKREIPLSELDDCIDVTSDGGILYNTWSRGDEVGLFERRPDGSKEMIWDCARWAFSSGASAMSKRYCYSNTVDWNPVADTVTLSFPYINTAVEIDRQTGELIGQWGEAPGSWRFEPSDWELRFNHFANITPDGTLLISTHAPGHTDPKTPGEHRFVEFEIDRENRTLKEKWVFGEGVDDWPMYKGEAHRTPSGNTLVNYGTGGVIREVSPEGETVWHAKWDADFDDDRFNKMVGHTVLLTDLYPLCEGFQ